MPTDLKDLLGNIDVEEPLGTWGFFVYSTYSASAALDYTPNLSTANQIELEEAAEALRDNPPAADSEEPSTPFDKFVIRRFQAYLQLQLDLQLDDPDFDRVWDALQLDYTRLPGASIDEARSHFRAMNQRLAGDQSHLIPMCRCYGAQRHRYFIIIDDESLRAIVEGPDYEDESKLQDGVIVKLVDGDYDEACGGIVFATMGRNLPKDSPFNITFYGWLRVPVGKLMSCWKASKYLRWVLCSGGKMWSTTTIRSHF